MRTVSTGGCRIAWKNWEKKFCAPGRNYGELGQFLKDSEALTGWANGAPSEPASRLQPAAWARWPAFLCILTQTRESPGGSPSLLAPETPHRELSLPSCRVVIQQKSGQEPALTQLVVGVRPSLGVGGGLA